MPVGWYKPRSWPSGAAALEEFLGDGLEDDPEIQREGSPFQIGQIEFEPHQGGVPGRGFTPEAVDLGKAGQPRPHLVPLHVARIQLLVRNASSQHARNMRPGSDKGHFSAQDVDQLGQLIEIAPPQELADRGVVLEDTPAVRGMINRVNYLVKFEVA